MMLPSLARLLLLSAQALPRSLAPDTASTPEPDFHFCRVLPGDRLPVARARHLHYICGALRLRPGQRVLLVGAGTGGAAVELARFADVDVVGAESSLSKVCLCRRSGRWAGLMKRYLYRSTTRRGGRRRRISRIGSRLYMVSARPVRVPFCADTHIHPAADVRNVTELFESESFDAVVAIESLKVRVCLSPSAPFGPRGSRS